MAEESGKALARTGKCWIINKVHTHCMYSILDNTKDRFAPQGDVIMNYILFLTVKNKENKLYIKSPYHYLFFNELSNDKIKNNPNSFEDELPKD
ncbi:MAG TPA: hypothetical protein VFP25_01290 [Nitrososphaeraceae archaeon]|nr:hypothetical protein [Nitrososphaeraceae archaeon]